MSSRLLPVSATPDARRLLWTRSLRGFADGVVSVLLADYLLRLGFSAAQVGVVVTSTCGQGAGPSSVPAAGSCSLKTSG